MSAPMSIGKWLRGARARSAQSGRLRRVLRGVLLVIIAIIALPYLLTPLYGWGRPVSVLMLTRWLSGAPVQREWVPLRQMGASLPLAVIVAEDSGFCDHRGIEWGALKQAIEDVSEGEVSGGGSTITQQTVKNLFFWPGRSYLRKALEVPLALWMDLILPKSRILEIYLNIAEWGPNGQFGAAAAARHAFAKPPMQISRSEAALLAATLPNPALRSARAPGRAVRRAGGIYTSRIKVAGDLDACLRE